MSLTDLKNTLLYGGLEMEAYRDLEPDIRAENSKNLTTYAGVAAIMFGGLAVTSVLTSTFASINVMAYSICCLLSAAIWLVLRTVPHSVVAVSGALDYVFCFILYGFSMWITTLHPEYPAVTAIVVLPVIPLLFTKKPMYLAAMTALVVIVFCALVCTCKQDAVAITDVWNAVTFGILSIAVAVIIVCMRLRGIAQSKQILHLVSHDALTGLKNRNSYEREISELAVSAKTSFGCVYADADGLHELNNACGHARGDDLLRCVASAIRDEFGDGTYRVGGDEFVALVVDQSEESVRRRLLGLRSRVESEGYSVSCGYACVSAQVSTDSIAVTQMVKDAEAEMFAQKAKYYTSSGHDRRSRSRADKTN